MPPRRSTPAKSAPASSDPVPDAMEVDASIEPPAAPAPTGTPWLPEVRRQHLELDAGLSRRAGGYVVGCATITCRPPPPGLGDVRLVTLHAHELMIHRVTIDGAHEPSGQLAHRRSARHG